MIFALSTVGQRLFVFLTPEDFAKLKAGHTLFVDEHQLGPQEFRGVTLAFAKTHDAVRDMLRQAGNTVTKDDEVIPKPEGTEAQCEGCAGIMPAHQILSKQCIVCWRKEAMLARHMRN